MNIRNEAELMVVFGDKVSKAIESVSKRVSKLLQKQIETDVFTTPNTWYERTGQFENAWEWTPLKRRVSEVVTELFYNPSGVEWDRGWEHGNPGKSAVKTLPDILNLAGNNYSPGYTSSLIFGNRHFSHFRRPYWDNLIKLLFDKGELQKMLKEELESLGLRIIA